MVWNLREHKGTFGYSKGLIFTRNCFKRLLGQWVDAHLFAFAHSWLSPYLGAAGVPPPPGWGVHWQPGRTWECARSENLHFLFFPPGVSLLGLTVIAASNGPTWRGTETTAGLRPASGAPGRAAVSSTGGVRGGRRGPAARSLAPTLLNGFLWLDVYLSFVFAFVSQLLNCRLTATFLSFFAARSWSWTGAPAHSPAPRVPLALRRPPGRTEDRVGAGLRTPARALPPLLYSMCPVSKALHHQNDSGIGGALAPQHARCKPLLLEPLCPGLCGSHAGSHQPLGDTRNTESWTEGRPKHHGLQTPSTSCGGWLVCHSDEPHGRSPFPCNVSVFWAEPWEQPRWMKALPAEEGRDLAGGATATGIRGIPQSPRTATSHKRAIALEIRPKKWCPSCWRVLHLHHPWDIPECFQSPVLPDFILLEWNMEHYILEL